MSFYNSLIDSSYLARVILLNSVDISDYRLFPSRPIANGPPVFEFVPPIDEGTAAGNLAQYIYVTPDKSCLILRFGRGKPPDWKGTYTRLFAAIADML